MTTTSLRFAVLCLCLLPLFIAGALAGDREQAQTESKGLGADQRGQNPVSVHYLEIVTHSVNETCEILAKANGVTFSEPVAELANARTAPLEGGWRIGVRAPLWQPVGGRP